MSERPLEPTGDRLRALLAEVSDHLVGVVDRMPDAPASDVHGVAELLADADLRRPPPEHGRPLGELLAVLDRAAGKGLNTASPGYFAFIPGSGLVSAAVAELIAAVHNRYTALGFPAPGLVALEADLLRWHAELFELPDTSAGLLTTGGSLATFSAVVAARATMLPADFLAGRAYATEHTHMSIAKAMRLAGFPPDAVRLLPADADQRMDTAALGDAVAADRAAGLLPFCVVANAGTTSTGVIDPLPAIADVARRERLWLHVDAAYGGYFQLTERGRARLRGIERADSLVLDAHKSLFLPFGTGCLLVRDGEHLRRAHAGDDAHYLQDIVPGDLPDFAEYGPELTRDTRGVRLWLPLHLHGVAAFRAALDEKLDLAEFAYRELRGHPRLAVLAAPDLSTVAFRCDTDAATAELLRRINAEQRAFLSSTRIDGRHVIRLCVLNHRTDLDRVRETVDAIRRHADAITDNMLVQ